MKKKTIAVTLAFLACLSMARAQSTTLQGKTPREVYGIYQEAVRSGDFDTYMLCLKLVGSVEQVKPMLRMAFPMMKQLLGSDVQIVDEKATDEKTTLILTGKVLDPDTQQQTESKGLVQLVLDAGVWKILEGEKWGKLALAVEAGLPGGLDDMPELPDDAPPVKVLAWKTVAKIRVASARLDSVRELLTDAEEAKKVALQAPHSDVVKAKVQMLIQSIADIKDIEKKIKEDFKAADEILQEALAIQKDVEETREAERKAAEEAERLRLEAVEQQRLAEEHKAKVEEEMEMVDTAKEAVVLFVKQHKYTEAIAELKQKIQELETDEAKAVLQRVVSRCERLHGLKRFIIRNLSESPLKWGWEGQEDVVGATEISIKLRGRSVPWAQVSTVQMLRLVDNYLSGPEARNIKLKDLGQQSLSAAIFCYEQGEGSDAAVKKAVEYAEKARSFYPKIEKEIRELLSPKVLENLQ